MHRARVRNQWTSILFGRLRRLTVNVRERIRECLDDRNEGHYLHQGVLVTPVGRKNSAVGRGASTTARRTISTGGRPISAEPGYKRQLKANAFAWEDSPATSRPLSEAAISQRARELTTNNWDIDEHLAVRDAAFNLHVLKGQQPIEVSSRRDLKS